MMPVLQLCIKVENLFFLNQCCNITKVRNVSAHINVENFRLILLITGVVIKLTRQVPLVEQELLTLPEHLSPPQFSVWFQCYSIFSFVCMLSRSSFVLLCFFFFWPLCCLFFFDIRILITPLVSSNSSNSLVIFKHNPIYTSSKCILAYNFNILCNVCTLVMYPKP